MRSTRPCGEAGLRAAPRQARRSSPPARRHPEGPTRAPYPHRRFPALVRRRDPRHAERLGRPSARSRRSGLHRPAGRLRHRPGGHPGRGGGARAAQRVRAPGRRRGVRPARGQREPGPGHRRHRGDRARRRRPQHRRSAAVPGVRERRGLRRRRGGPAALPVPRPAPAGPGARPSPARQGELRRAPRPRGTGLRRGGDPHADPLDARGRPRLPRARAAVAGELVCAPAVTAAVQAAPHGRGPREVLPDRPLLPRRGLPRRPPAGVHAARRRDELRRPGRRHGRLRGRPRRAVGAHRRHAPAADPADDLRRRDAPLRHGQAGPALRQRAHRAHRVLRCHPLPGLPGALRRRRRHAGRGVPAAAHVRRVAGVGQAARGARARVRHGGRRRRAGRPGGQEHLRGRARRPRRGHRRAAGGLHLLRGREGRQRPGPCSAPRAWRSPAGAT